MSEDMGVAAEAAGLSPTVEPASSLDGFAPSIPNAFDYGEVRYQLAQLRHAYALMRGGHVSDQPRFADGFLRPAIREFERFTRWFDGAMFMMARTDCAPIEFSNEGETE